MVTSHSESSIVRVCDDIQTRHSKRILVQCYSRDIQLLIYRRVQQSSQVYVSVQQSYQIYVSVQQSSQVYITAIPVHIAGIKR